MSGSGPLHVRFIGAISELGGGNGEWQEGSFPLTCIISKIALAQFSQTKPKPFLHKYTDIIHMYKNINIISVIYR